MVRPLTYSIKFKTALARVADSEGGNTDHPDDEGGRTGQGILQTEYDAWLKKHGKPANDVFNMPEAHRLAIYHENYWIPMKAEQMPLPIAYMAFDTAVLHGVGFAPKALQAGLGVLQDGVLGPVSLAAAKAQDPLRVWARLRDARWKRMQTRKSFPTFKKGWLKRLNDVEANVKKMARLPS